MTDLGVVTRHTLRLASVGRNPPHIHFRRRKTSNEINVTPVRGPDVIMTVETRLIDEYLFRITAISIYNKRRVTGRKLVVDDSLSVERPRSVHASFKKGSGNA